MFFYYYTATIRSNWEFWCNVQTRDNTFTFHTLTQCCLKTPSAPSTPPPCSSRPSCTVHVQMRGPVVFLPFSWGFVALSCTRVRIRCTGVYQVQITGWYLHSSSLWNEGSCLVVKYDHVLITSFMHRLTGESLTLDVTLKRVLKLALDQVNRVINNYKFLPSRFKVAVEPLGSWAHTGSEPLMSEFKAGIPQLTGKQLFFS